MGSSQVGELSQRKKLTGMGESRTLSAPCAARSSEDLVFANLLLPLSWHSEPRLFSRSQNRSLTSPLRFSISKLGMMCVKLPEILCREVPQKWKVLAISILVNILLDSE